MPAERSGPANGPGAEPSLLQRLKERKLVQWAVAYLAGAFVVFQLMDALETPLGLSAGIQQAILAILAVGFFVTLVLAWYHGEKGRQRVSGPELLMVAALLVVAGVALMLLRPQEDGFSPVALEGDDRPGIAVFPCENWSPDPDDAYFASGIHDEILSNLARISGLRSVARETMERYDESSVSTRQVAQELGVGFLGECSVLKDMERDRVRLTFQLFDGNTGTHLWAQTYDEDLTARSIFDIHSDLAGRIARAIGAALTPEEQSRIEKDPTTNLDAYDLYLLGRNRFSTRSPETIREAIDYFEAAVELDSTFALAFTGIADAYMVLPFYDLTTEPLDVYPQSRASAIRAFELDPSLGEVHASLGFISLIYELDWEAAERYLSSAVELAPGYPSAHHWYSNFLASVGRAEEALAEAEEALSLNPRSNALVWMFADRLFLSGQTGEARQRYEQAMAMEPPVPWASLTYLMSLALEKPTDPVRAGELWAEFVTLYGYPLADSAAAVVEGLLGRFREVWPPALEDQTAASTMLDDLVERTPLDRSDLLFAYCGLATPDACFSVLEEAFRLKHFWLAFLPASAEMYRPDITDDPRWEEFLTRIGYPGSGEE